MTEQKEEVIAIRKEEEENNDTEIKFDNPIDWNTENELYSKYDLSRPVGGGKFSLYQVIRNFLSQLATVNQAYRISIPVCLLQPMSFLERLSIQATPTNFLGTFSKLQEGERFLRILQWELTTWSKINREGIEQAKPYNPILGEIFSCGWKHNGKRDKSTTYFIAEQVSHHPPISAFHCENGARQITFSGTVFPSLQIGWNSITLKVLGNTVVELGKFGEVYHIKYPSICAANLIKGTQRLEVFDKLTIECPKTKWKAELDFKFGKEGYVNGSVGQDGDIAFKVSGFLDKKIFMTMVDDGSDESPQKILFVDYGRLNKRDQKVVKPLGLQKNNESRRVWHELTKLIVEGNVEKGNEMKNQIEEAQRAKRREREEKNEEFVPSFFENIGRHKMKDNPSVTIVEGDIEAVETKWKISKEARALLLEGKL